VALDRYQAALATVADLRQRLVSESFQRPVRAGSGCTSRAAPDRLGRRRAGDRETAVSGRWCSGGCWRRGLPLCRAARPSTAARGDRILLMPATTPLDRVLAAYGDLLRATAARPPPVPPTRRSIWPAHAHALIAAYGADWTALLIVSGDTC
jgi:hypothetical protein